MSRKSVLMVLMLAVMILSTASVYAAMTCQPPTEGPGSSDYRYTSVREPDVIGSGAKKYIIYEPENVTEKLPVIVYLHGYAWLWVSPNASEAFVHHLVKKGHIVIWPYYQLNFSSTPVERFDLNAGEAVRAALDHITDPETGRDHAQPARENDEEDGDILYALIGHSAGAITAGNVAATYLDYDLPAPKALVCMHPGRGENSSIPFRQWNYADYSDMYLLVIAGDADDSAGADGHYIWNEVSDKIADENKDWILVRSDDPVDDNGNVILEANHYNPVGFLPEEQNPYNNSNDYNIDCHDWYGYWKWATALCDLGFNRDPEENRSYALGDGGANQEQLCMGYWNNDSDDPVKEALVFDCPAQQESDTCD